MQNDVAHPSSRPQDVKSMCTPISTLGTRNSRGSPRSTPHGPGCRHSLLLHKGKGDATMRGEKVEGELKGRVPTLGYHLGAM